MPLTCASEHSCGSVLVPPMIYQPSVHWKRLKERDRRSTARFDLDARADCHNQFD